VSAAPNVDMPYGVQRVCDGCHCVKSAWSLRVDADIDPDGRRVLALILSVSKKPPEDPAFNPAEMIDVARWCQQEDFCSHDCFLNRMDELWNLGKRRAKRFWETGERDWK